ncbi:MAG: hypothetical protein C0434_01550 [Xanthomonadaceae bacterium]|nr:hypothetical protein [Xanthomonadaceae bacterium]
MLTAGPLLAQDLVDRGGFSPASLYLNLKALKAEGAVDTRRDGRAVRYLFVGPLGGSAGRSRATKSTRGRRSQAMSGVGPALTAEAELKAALGVLLTRLSPIENASEKIMVLSELAGSLPAPVATVLKAVADDLDRLRGKG